MCLIFLLELNTAHVEQMPKNFHGAPACDLLDGAKLELKSYLGTG